MIKYYFIIALISKLIIKSDSPYYEKEVFRLDQL
ncbi:hypothetical protein ABID22_003059 [Pontibacter aydingkolensis]